MRQIFTVSLFLVTFALKAQVSKDFEFVMQWKTGSVPSMYISSENLYVRERIVDPPETFKVKLPNIERAKIYDKIMSMNFLSYPSEYKYETNDTIIGINSSCTKFTFTVFFNGKSKTVKWDDCTTSESSIGNKYENLDELKSLVGKSIFTKLDPKKLKPLRAGYL